MRTLILGNIMALLLIIGLIIYGYYKANKK